MANWSEPKMVADKLPDKTAAPVTERIESKSRDLVERESKTLRPETERLSSKVVEDVALQASEVKAAPATERVAPTKTEAPLESLEIAARPESDPIEQEVANRLEQRSRPDAKMPSFVLDRLTPTFIVPLIETDAQAQREEAT